MTEPTGENKIPTPTQPGLPEIINAMADRIEPIIRLVTTIYERRLTQRETEIKLTKHLSRSALGVIALVVVSASWLTYVGKVDGSTFGFLLGVIVGYVLTFVKDALNPPRD